MIWRHVAYISKQKLNAMLNVNPVGSESRALLHALLFSTPCNIFKACAIACVTFVKRMRHTSALNASKSAQVWTQQLLKAVGFCALCVAVELVQLMFCVVGRWMNACVELCNTARHAGPCRVTRMQSFVIVLSHKAPTALLTEQPSAMGAFLTLRLPD